MIELERRKATPDLVAKLKAATTGYADYLDSFDITTGNEAILVTASIAASVLLTAAKLTGAKPDEMVTTAKGLLHMQFVPNAEVLIEMMGREVVENWKRVGGEGES